MEKLEKKIDEVSNLVAQGGIDMGKNIELCDKLIEEFGILEQLKEQRDKVNDELID